MQLVRCGGNVRTTSPRMQLEEAYWNSVQMREGGGGGGGHTMGILCPSMMSCDSDFCPTLFCSATSARPCTQPKCMCVTVHTSYVFRPCHGASL
ncbi:hypothetical protein FKM82_027021 [Ascaphus truei]